MNTLASKTASAAGALTAEAEKRKKAADAEAAQKMRIAQAFDNKAAQTPGGIELPWMIHVYSLYGSAGSLSYKDQTPEQVLALAQAFPALPAGLHRPRAGTSYKLASAATDEPEAFTLGCGYVLRMDGGLGYGFNAKVEWFTELESGLTVRISAELKQVYGITPRYVVRTQSFGGGFEKVISDCVVFPLSPDGSGLREVTYGRGSDTAYKPRLFWAGANDAGMSVLAHVRLWANECFNRRLASRKAYEADKAAGLPPEPIEGGPYESRSLKNGTKAQTDCLESEEARRDWALAKRHWQDYAKDNGLDGSSKYGADHYAWARHWLARHGLLIDPNGPGEGGYKYGSAWL